MALWEPVMLISSLVAFVHFAAVFGIVATLVFEWLTLTPQPTLAEARRLARADRWYGISAVVLLVAGFVRAYWFEKGIAYYQANPFFAIKLGLFLAMGLLSIVPTVRFIRWGAELKAGRAPAVSAGQYRRVALCLRLQLLLLPLVALCASLMAHGIGA
jgi:putative membrane protein